MTSHIPHNWNDPIEAVPSPIPIELQLWDNPHQENINSHSHTFPPSKESESGNATDVDANVGRVGGNIRGTSDAEAELQVEDPETVLVYQQLKPVDGGPAAWRLLIAAFVFEAILWGLLLLFLLHCTISRWTFSPCINLNRKVND